MPPNETALSLAATAWIFAAYKVPEAAQRAQNRSGLLVDRPLFQGEAL
jgi:hypothetical protein